MTGDIMSYAHKDIYYLETKTKSQTSEDFVNLFASPAGRELVKYKPKTKTKYKANSAVLDFFTLKPSVPAPETLSRAVTSTPTPTSTSTSGNKSPSVESVTTPASVSSVFARTQPRRKSLDLYNEAASILGLTCSQTNDCKCIECQCHYFDDYEEDSDYESSDGFTDQSLCSIQ